MLHKNMYNQSNKFDQQQNYQFMMQNQYQQMMQQEMMQQNMPQNFNYSQNTNYQNYPQQEQHEDIEKGVLDSLNYYFSEENLNKDAFFRSKMNSNGYVDVITILGFNKINSSGFTPEKLVEVLENNKTNIETCTDKNTNVLLLRNKDWDSIKDKLTPIEIIQQQKKTKKNNQNINYVNTQNNFYVQHPNYMNSNNNQMDMNQYQYMMMNNPQYQQQMYNYQQQMLLQSQMMDPNYHLMQQQMQQQQPHEDQ